MGAFFVSTPEPLALWPGEHAPKQVEMPKGLAGAQSHAGQGVFGHVGRHAGLLGQEFVDIPQQAATAADQEIRPAQCPEDIGQA